MTHQFSFLTDKYFWRIYVLTSLSSQLMATDVCVFIWKYRFSVYLDSTITPILNVIFNCSWALSSIWFLILTDFLRDLFLNSLKLIEQPWNGKMPFVVKFKLKAYSICIISLRWSIWDWIVHTCLIFLSRTALMMPIFQV